MENQIQIREAVTEHEVAAFWEQLRIYFKRDIFPDPEDEDRAYFLSDTEYRAHMQKIHDRPQDRCYYLFFQRDGQDIGFAMPVIFTTEDGKCFIMEFCVLPEFRGNGTGRACARALLSWAKERGALYAELNCGGDERRPRFWRSVGFIENGADEWGEPLMILPPRERSSIYRRNPFRRRGLAAFEAGKWILKRNRGRSADRRKAEAASTGHPGWKAHILYRKTRLPGRGNVQRGKVLFHLCLHRQWGF